MKQTKKLFLIGIIFFLSIRLVLADVNIFPNYYDVSLYPGENNKTSIYIENSYDEYKEITVNLSATNTTILNCTFLDYSISKTYNISGYTAIQDYINMSSFSDQMIGNTTCRITYNWTTIDVPASSVSGGGGGGGGGSSTPSGVNLNSVAFAIIEGREGDKIYFVLDNINHYVYFSEIWDRKAKLIISSPFRYLVELEEGKFDILDMDNDGTKDFKISLIKSDGNWADIKLERFVEDKTIDLDVKIDIPNKNQELGEPKKETPELPIRKSWWERNRYWLVFSLGSILALLVIFWLASKGNKKGKKISTA